jgi:hypothetical protein
MDSLPEHIVNKIYKDVHGLDFHTVMDQLVINKMKKMLNTKMYKQSYDENDDSINTTIRIEKI